MDEAVSEPVRPALLPLDIERAIVFRSGGNLYRHVFHRVGANDWDGFFSRIEAEIEQREGAITRTVSAESATLWLYSQCIVRAEGYRVSDGRKLEELPVWRERIPSGHRLKAANMLTVVNAAGAQDGVIEAEGESVTLDATWSEQDGGMAKFSGLLHRFATPSAEHRRRFLRARSRAVVMGGSRGGRTVIPSMQPVLAKLYDELVISVDGYAASGRALASREEIVREMDVYHKVIAAREIFETFVPEEAQEAAA